MADEEQAPRKTTTYNKFEGMASQNERYNVKQNEMFWIENIMRTGPRKLSSIPGPGTATASHFPPWLPPGWIINPGGGGSCPACPCLTSDDGDPTIFFAVSAISSAPCSRFIGILTCADDVQFSQAEFKNTVVGNPRSGVAVRVSPTATASNFTGYGLIYDPGAATQKLVVVKWVGASLQTMGTILSSQNTTLALNDVVTLTATTIGAANELRVFINDLIQPSLTATDSAIPTTNDDAGFIVVGNTGADDRMEWTKLSANCMNHSALHTLCPCLSPDPLSIVIECCSLDCVLSCTNGTVEIRACGGVAPYSWQVLSGDAVVTPEVDTHFAIVNLTKLTSVKTAELGYKIFHNFVPGIPGISCDHDDITQTQYNPTKCDGVLDGGFYVSASMQADSNIPAFTDCLGASFSCSSLFAFVPYSPFSGTVVDCVPYSGHDTIIDVRDIPNGMAPMTFNVAQNPTPGATEIHMSGTVLTLGCCADTNVVVQVTDFNGLSTTIYLGP